MKHIDKEYCLPFDNDNPEFWMRIEHLGRYVYATDCIKRNKLETVLDVACADGYGCLEMAETAQCVHGVDYNEKLIDTAKNMAVKAKKINLHFHKADLNLGSPNDLPAPDMITCFDTLEHLNNPEKFLTRLSSILKKNGTLLLSVPKAKYESMNKDGKPTNTYHLHRFSEEDICSLLNKSGFCIDKVLGQPYTNICMSLENNACRDTDTQKNQIRKYFDQSKPALRFFARMFGIPSSDFDEYSYSMFVTAKKI